MTLSQISLTVVGINHLNQRGPTRRSELALCKSGEPVDLRPEPTNPADPNAIAVYSCRGVQLGYLTAERAPRIGQIMRQGIQTVAIFQAEARHSAVIRVAFYGDKPRLPDIPQPSNLEPEWYDDYISDE